MRIDALLKALCLVKTRSLARKGCETGSVRISGAVVKPSREVREGDIIELRWPERTLAVEILEIPARQASKKEASRFYRIVRDKGPRGQAEG